MKNLKLKIELLPKALGETILVEHLLKKTGVFQEMHATKEQTINVRFVDMKQMI